MIKEDKMLQLDKLRKELQSKLDEGDITGEQFYSRMEALGNELGIQKSEYYCWRRKPRYIKELGITVYRLS